MLLVYSLAACSSVVMPETQTNYKDEKKKILCSVYCIQYLVWCCCCRCRCHAYAKFQSNRQSLRNGKNNRRLINNKHKRMNNNIRISVYLSCFGYCLLYHTTPQLLSVSVFSQILIYEWPRKLHMDSRKISEYICFMFLFFLLIGML